MSFKDYVVQNVISIVDKNQKLYICMKNQTCPKCEKDQSDLYMCRVCKTFGCTNCISFKELCSEHTINPLGICSYTKCKKCRKYVWCNECSDNFDEMTW